MKSDLSRLSTHRRLDTTDPATADRDLGRLSGTLDELFRSLDGVFRRRPQRTPTVITSNTDRPVLRFDEMALVYTVDGAATLYLPRATSRDAGRVCAFLKQFENFHVNLRTTDGSLINGSYPLVHGITQLGQHEVLWDGAGWWIKEPAARVRVHDTSFRPTGLWQFTDPDDLLADTSGNGYDLTVETGTERSTYISGDRGGFYFDGATSLWYDVAEPLLRLTGDMAFFCLWANHTGVTNASFVSHGAAGETEATNQLYQFRYGTYPGLAFTSESGGGVDATHTDANLISLPGQIAHVGFTRASGVVQFWHNGRKFGDPSAVLTTPTGGADGRLRLGSAGAAAPVYINGAMTSGMLLNYLPPDAECRRAYNMCLGQVLGFCVEVGDA